MQNTTDPPDERGLLNLAVDLGLGTRPVYLIITRGQEAAGEALDSLPVGWAYTLGQKLVDAGLARLMYTNPDASVLELVPPPSGTKAPNPGAPGPANPNPALS